MATAQATRIIVAARVAAIVMTLAACTSDRVAVGQAGRPPPAVPVECDAVNALATVQSLFGELTAGRRVDVGTYFATASQFVRWIDPDAGEIIAGPSVRGPVTLDDLQSHLDHLADRVSIRLESFQDEGFERDVFGRDAGEWFVFTVRAQLAPEATAACGYGGGVVDCGTGKIKDFVIESW
jgi:hypothetical protein